MRLPWYEGLLVSGVTQSVRFQDTTITLRGEYDYFYNRHQGPDTASTAVYEASPPTVRVNGLRLSE